MFKIYLNTFSVNSNQESEIKYGNINYPLEIFFDDLSNYDIGFIPWHWHNEIQFAIVNKGSVEFSFVDKSVVLSEGNGVFISSNTLHQMKPIISGSIVINITFNHSLIGGNHLSLIENKYINPIINNSNLPFILLDNNIKWNQDILVNLFQVYKSYEKGDFGYELEIKNLLSKIWLILARNLIPDLISNYKDNPHGNERLKTMLEYIHKNYSDNISLEDIASSIHISKSECCRSFKKYLKNSPFQYLMQYRIIEASKLLQNTNKAITEIMNSVGFNDPSYFTRTFKRFTGYTPSQYRKQFR